MNQEEVFKSYKGKKGNMTKKVLKPAQEPEVFRLVKKALRVVALRRMSRYERWKNEEEIDYALRGRQRPMPDDTSARDTLALGI
ncbi:hypothetical protein BSNK01_10060 [Bacillaceae bacterium]